MNWCFSNAMESGALITAKLPAKTVARAIRETKSCQSRRKCGHRCQSRRKCSRHYQSRRRRYPLRNEPPRLSHGRKDTAPLVRHAPHRRMGWPDRAMAAETRHSRLGVRAVSACPISAQPRRAVGRPSRIALRPPPLARTRDVTTGDWPLTCAKGPFGLMAGVADSCAP